MSVDTTEELPRWNVSDVHASLTSRSFVDAMDRQAADVDRLVALFDELGVGAVADRRPDEADGATADRAIGEWNRIAADLTLLHTYINATLSTDSRDQDAQRSMSQLSVVRARFTPLLARLAEWVAALGVDELAELSDSVREHAGPLRRLAVRTAHQMPEPEEQLYAELATTGSAAWNRLQRDLTSQLSATVSLPSGETSLPMPAIRGLATHADPAVRRAAYEAELGTWPTIEVAIAAAMNAIKGEANAVNRRRRWDSPLDASLFANAVGRRTFDAMQAAVVAALPDLRRWMRTKAVLHGGDHRRGLPWWDLVAPLPAAADAMSWEEGIGEVRAAFADFAPSLGSLVDRALDERWIDAAARDGKTGGAFCAPFVGDRSLVLLNWAGSADSTQTTAHELGHAYHNTTLARRSALQRRLPMALAETASIFCETLVVEAGLAGASGTARLALLDVDLQGTNQVIVDIHSRYLFETEVFRRRERGSLSAAELCELMTEAQAAAYGDGLDLSTAHPHMWLLKPHYYGSHFYNWPYTYGLLFGLGLHSCYRDDPERFRAGYDELLSRAGMETAEQLGARFGLDVADEAFWTGSLDIVRARIAEHRHLAEVDR